MDRGDALGGKGMPLALLTMFVMFLSPFWALPTLFLTRSTAAVAVAMVNSIGNLGGFFGPYAIGWAKRSTGSATGGLLFLGGLTAVAFVLALTIRVGEAGEAESPRPTPARPRTRLSAPRRSRPSSPAGSPRRSRS
ncbi:transporter transmembrane protein [Streptomyces bingchenggensis BCW-1]|uniref:Transporter transmembrane protein n=1 Tax=Streptomyces bingchenggensis (strain BCW-1) TaxID=749414 RepID=D7C4E9_STRBB|nr:MULTISPECIES: hypothetical protein [Streptomyces]ADI03971.1 transporter transmembrane protein [Streptomyces bingchenggensis BCW-1]